MMRKQRYSFTIIASDEFEEFWKNQESKALTMKKLVFEAISKYGTKDYVLASLSENDAKSYRKEYNKDRRELREANREVVDEKPERKVQTEKTVPAQVSKVQTRPERGLNSFEEKLVNSKSINNNQAPITNDGEDMGAIDNVMDLFNK